MVKNLIIAIIIIAILAIGFKLFDAAIKPKSAAIPLPKVTVQNPQWNEVVEYVTQTGTLVAYNSVDLVARVEGYLEEIQFADGSIVEKGQPLFVIQPKPYLEKLKAAKANVKVQKATYAYSKSEYERQKKMYRENATSLNNVEKWLAKVQEAKGAIDEAIANEIIAKIDYSYTHVHAPFDGRIGRHLVDAGNLVGNGVATTLANVQQINPIYAYFNLNELDLIRLRAAAQARGIKATDLSKIPVYVRLQNEETFTHQGTLDFANTALNASTGTLEFRALLTNDNHVLLPGLFVQVRIPVTPPNKQLTIPSAAVLYDQIGAYVLTVDAQNVVQLVRVELGSVDQEQQSITKGLTEQDRVIISGLQFATPSNPVQVTEQPATTTAQSSSNKQSTDNDKTISTTQEQDTQQSTNATQPKVLEQPANIDTPTNVEESEGNEPRTDFDQSSDVTQSTNEEQTSSITPRFIEKLVTVKQPTYIEQLATDKQYVQANTDLSVSILQVITDKQDASSAQPINIELSAYIQQLANVVQFQYLARAIETESPETTVQPVSDEQCAYIAQLVNNKHFTNTTLALSSMQPNYIEQLTEHYQVVNNDFQILY